DMEIRVGAAAATLEKLLASVTELTSKANPPASIWLARAELERSLGKLREAEQSGAKAALIDPNDLAIKYLRADIALRLGDTMKAQSFADEITAAEPDSIARKRLSANILIAENKYDEALAVLNSIENAPPDVAELRDRLTVQTS